MKASLKAINANQRDQYSWIAKTEDYFVFTAEIDHIDKKGNKYNHKAGWFHKVIPPLSTKNGDASGTVSHAKELFNAINDTYSSENKCRLLLVKGTKYGTTDGGIRAAIDPDFWMVRELSGNVGDGFSFVLERTE
mgnify:CR=1 FL=1